MSKTVQFQIIQFSISTQFKCKYNLIVKNISISNYSVLIQFSICTDLVYPQLHVKQFSLMSKNSYISNNSVKHKHAV